MFDDFTRPELMQATVYAYSMRLIRSSSFFCRLSRGLPIIDEHWPNLFPVSLPKPQFSSWLIEQVGTGQYVGLQYVDTHKFRVPWKHNSRKDCSDEDSKIFRVSMPAD